MFWILFFVLQSTLATVNTQLLPDKGERLLKQVQDLEAALSALNISTADITEKGTTDFFCPRTLQNSFSRKNSINLHMACGLYEVC